MRGSVLLVLELVFKSKVPGGSDSRRLGLVAGAAVLAASACGTGSNEGDLLLQEPIRLAPPAIQSEPSAKLSGAVYAAREPGLEKDTQKPPGYRMLTDGGTVAVWPAACAEPCAGRVAVPVKGGGYEVEDLPVDRALVVEATAPGMSRRRMVTYLRADTHLDFAADPGRATGAYLVDSPEVVEVDPPPGSVLPPAGPLRFRVTYSEPIDPASVTPRALALTSRDIAGLAIGGGDAFPAGTASIRLEGPTTVVFEIPGPIATVAGAAGAAIDLSVGKGTLREATAGRAVASDGPALAVSGLAWAPGASGVGYRLGGDTEVPSLLGATAGTSKNGVRVVMRWSEPMAAATGGGAPGKRVGSGLLDPGAYELRGASGEALEGFELTDLALAEGDPAFVTALATGSSLPGGRVVIIPRGVSDPAGNKATGSASVSMPSD